MADPWIAPSGRDELLARVVARGRRIVLVRRLVTALVVAAGVAAGAAGVALGTGTGSGDRGGLPWQPLAQTVVLHDCPEGQVVGELPVGERIRLTGRSPDGAWLELRDPVDPATHRWIPTATLGGGAPLDELGVVEGCGDRPGQALDGGAGAPGSAGTEGTDGGRIEQPGAEPSPPDQSAPPASTEPARPAAAPTTVASPSRSGPSTTSTVPPPGPTATSPASPPTTPPALSDPSFGPISRSVATIREDLGGACDTSLPTTSAVSGSASHPAGITTVQVRRRIGTGPWETWQTIATQGGPFSFSIGPYPADTVPAWSTRTVSFELRATSAQGTTSLRPSTPDESVDLIWCSLA